MASLQEKATIDMVQFLGLHDPRHSTLRLFPWVYVKERMFVKKVQDVEERVREVIGSITPAMLRNKWRKRLNAEFKPQTLRANHVGMI